MQYDISYNKEKINQSLIECAAWLTTLNVLKEESYSLKTKLSEALDSNTNNELIAEAENFHNLILTRDEYIKDIAADTRDQEKRLKEIASKKTADKYWTKTQQKLRNEIAYLEQDFSKMREDFYRRFLKRIVS